MEKSQRITQQKIYIAAVIVCVVFLLAGVLFLRYAIDENERETREYMQEVAQQSKLAVDKQVQGDFQTLEGIAGIIGSMENPDFEALLPVLNEINQGNAFIRMGFTERNGLTDGVDIDGKLYEDVDLSSKGFVEQAYAGEEVITRTQRAVDGDFWANYYAVPIRHNGEVVKVLCAVNDSSIFSEIMDTSMFGGKGYASIIDKDGAYIIRSNHPSLAADRDALNLFELYPFGEEEQARIKADFDQGKSGFAEYTYRGVRMWASYTPLDVNGWYIFSVVPEAEINETFAMLTWGLVGIIVGAILVFAFLMILIKRTNDQGLNALKKMAFTDQLTGYRNYPKFLIDVRKLLGRKKDKQYSLWYSDLKNFKIVNAMFGYDIGDGVLKFWADLIESDMREGEAFCRVSGDNFVVLREYISREESLRRFSWLCEQLGQFPGTANRGYKLEMCSGIYVIEEHDDQTINDMMDAANVAQKSVKHLSGPQVAFYSAEMREKIVRETELEARMESALENGEFKVYMQPKIDIQHGDIVAGAEALARWISPEDGFLSPAEFIPLFERNGFVIKLDEYMFESVCRMYHERLDSGRVLPVVISVNVSRLCMLQTNFVEKYIAIKNKYRIPDRCIELEFTESLAFDNHDRFRDIVEAFQANGFLCSLDDFGAGHSSLNILKDLPMDVLKIDMLFFREGENANRDREIVKGIVNMAKALCMKTVAEGVESFEQVEFLRKTGCDIVQGYVYSKPLPVEEFDEFVEERQKKEREGK
ncbi:MAG: EAL domain-containing protein [Christensenella sp.]|uniref:bifunctional diguanylate cyclase/phosphodiesterase n=1 Tax=Christensenella sp. TaxID=1935934 RepID=UPI002B1F575F|nr:EAL domain-containing protein [Christensenella sp.]MEA5002944.1 EAL domain-containing protein [Christensenella sp.]